MAVQHHGLTQALGCGFAKAQIEQLSLLSSNCSFAFDFSYTSSDAAVLANPDNLLRAPGRGERPNLQKVLRPRAVPVAFQHLRVRVVASAASKAHCSGSGHNDHGPHHFPARISKPAQPNNSFKPSPLRGLACAVRFTTPFGRYAGRLNSGVRLRE